LLANEFYTDIGAYTVTAVSMHVYQNWMNKLPLLIDNQPSLDIYSLVEPKKQTINWTQFKVEVSRLLRHEQDLRVTEADKLQDIITGLQSEFHEDVYDALLVMSVTIAIKKKAHGALSELLPKLKNDVWLIACLEYMVRRLGTSFHSLIHTIFDKTIAQKYETHQVIILDYIFHSTRLKEAEDKLDGVRR